MESFHWDTHFETGLAEVDQQHHQLVDLINRFGDLLARIAHVPLGELEALLDELATYASFHFQEEESLMRQKGLHAAHIEQHCQLHANFFDEIVKMRACVSQHVDAAEPLLKFLIYWLAFHILGTDQSMARQIRAIEEGQAPEQAFLEEKVVKESVIEPLLSALNGLFHQLSERNRDLLDLNRSLEAKVEERTRSLSEANRMLEELALTDVLTGLPNRRHAMARLAQAWAESDAQATPLACMMIDADGFKLINDQFGHEAGDEVLRQLAGQMRHAVRTDDVVCRLGGDEFLIVCPATALGGVLKAAEALRSDVARMRVAVIGGGEWRGSVSIGVAARTEAMAGLEDLIRAADEGVYIAKRNGRNRVGCTAIAPSLAK